MILTEFQLLRRTHFLGFICIDFSLSLRSNLISNTWLGDIFGIIPFSFMEMSSFLLSFMKCWTRRFNTTHITLFIPATRLLLSHIYILISNIEVPYFIDLFLHDVFAVMFIVNLFKEVCTRTDSI